MSQPVSLVVEPHEDTRELYIDQFQRLGWETLGANDGATALSKALERPPTLLLTELRLPRIDGAQLIDILKNDTKTASVSVIVVTADARPTALVEARRAGADAVLAKPVELDALFARVEQMMRRRTELVGESEALRDRVHVALSDAKQILHRTRALSHSMGRYSTVTPPDAPPALLCPICDAQLEYERSFIGGVNKRSPERWDYYKCPRDCGQFQFRQRTRKLRHVS